MKKLFSDIQGKMVYSRDSGGPVARVFDLILDPVNGTFVALSVHPFLKKVVGMRDIISWYPKVVIRDVDCIVDPDEVMRIKEVLDKGYAPFLDNTVVTESGKKLGKVYDYLFDIDAGILLKMMVAKNFLGLVHTSERVIPASDIIRVEADCIIVKDDMRIREATPELMGA